MYEMQEVEQRETGKQECRIQKKNIAENKEEEKRRTELTGVQDIKTKITRSEKGGGEEIKEQRRYE